MKIKKEIELADFLKAIAQAHGAVWLTSIEGDQYNLKSTLSRYVALGALISERSNDLELFCQLPEDEPLFLQFFAEHPETV